MKEKGLRAESGVVRYHDRALTLVRERWIMLYVVIRGGVCRSGFRVETAALLGSMVVRCVCAQATFVYEVA